MNSAVRLLVLGIFLVSLGFGISIPVPNYSFESPDVLIGQYPNYTGASEFWYRVKWTTDAAGSAGPRQLPIGGAPDTSIHDQAAGVGRGAALYHTGVPLTSLPTGYLYAGTYTLTWDLGIRSDQTLPRPFGYQIDVWGMDSLGNVVGTSALGSYSYTFPNGFDWTGRWIDDLSFTFVAATTPSITQLQIRLINLTPGFVGGSDPVGGSAAAQILFDRIRLDASLVPEPSTYALMGTVGLALYLLRRRKSKATKA